MQMINVWSIKLPVIFGDCSGSFFGGGTGFGSTGTHSVSVCRCCCPDDTGNCIRMAFACSEVFGGIGVAFYRTSAN